MRPQSFLSVAATIFLAGSISVAQTNLLVNANADLGTSGWRAVGNAKLEEFNGKKVFVIRSDDNDQIYGFHQIIDLQKSDVGRYVLFIGQGSSERINADRAITGLPYLYGYMLKSYSSKGAPIVDYLHDLTMLARPPRPNQWVTMWGIYRVPKETVAIQFTLSQAERRSVPPNGSAARFRQLGLYLFDSEQEALDFAKTYNQDSMKEP